MTKLPPRTKKARSDGHARAEPGIGEFMRIIFNGQQAFGKSVLEALLDRGEDVVGVFCAPGKEGSRPDPLKEFAAEKGLPLVAYEGGQGLRAGYPAKSNNTLNNYLMEFNRDSRMSELYDIYLDVWKDNGGTEMMHFNSVEIFSRHGSWGAMEHQNDDPSITYKYNALVDFINKNPVWW